MDRSQSRTLFYEIATGKICAPLANKVAENIHGCIGSIIDKHGKLWIGCMEGVYIIDLHSRTSTGEFQHRHLKFKLDDPDSRLIEKSPVSLKPKMVLCGWEVTDTVFTNGQ